MLDAPSPRLTLLVTATVRPLTPSFVAVGSPATRLAEYREALRHHLAARSFARVVFCESSGADLTALREVDVEGNVEFLSFQDGGATPVRGKGYGELTIMRHALEHGTGFGEDDVVVKISGRYSIRNLAQLADALRREGTGHDVVADLRLALTMADTRVCAFRTGFARRFLLPQQHLVDDAGGYHLEHAFARAVHLAVADGLRWRPWPIEPDIAGVSGSSGFAYRRSLLRRAYRSALRKVQWVSLAR